MMRSAACLLGVIGVMTMLVAPADAQSFRRPFTCSDCISNWFYFDQTTPGPQDWSCAGSTYEGHRGTDFTLAGGNAAIEAGHDVVASADGEVVSAQDGHFDHCEACGGPGCGIDHGFGFGNHVVIDHGAFRTVYAHLRTGSVRVAPGTRVTCGEVLGQIGSSGCSSGAHLHFEVRPRGASAASALDPFEGACSPTSASLWTDQGGHRALPAALCEGAPAIDAGSAASDAGLADRPRAGSCSCRAGVASSAPVALIAGLGIIVMVRARRRGR